MATKKLLRTNTNDAPPVPNPVPDVPEVPEPTPAEPSIPLQPDTPIEPPTPEPATIPEPDLPSRNIGYKSQSSGENVYNLSTRLFGIPHQFPPIVDPRVRDISTTVGASYAEKILADGAVCTLIPGKPKYLPNESHDAKTSITSGLLLSSNGRMNNLFVGREGDINDSDSFRLYDFEKCYHEYMSYVNLLCRVGAAFLGLDGVYNLPGASGDGVSFKKYNWANYKWNNTAKASNITTFFSRLNKGSKTEDDGVKTDDGHYGGERLESILQNTEYVQFYVDPESASTDSLSNSQTESQIKSLFDSNSGLLKEIAFMMDSGAAGEAANNFGNFISESMGSLGAFTEETLNGTPFSALGRIINLGGNVLKGENIVIPDIYQSTTYTKSYDITVHLRSPYGTKLSYYLNIFVPMMHLMAFAMPRATSPNSFHSPFIVKAFIEGAWSCNLGLAQSITVTKVGESRSIDGLPMEVDVSLSIADLYSDLSMNSSSDIVDFIHNTSLVDYLATNCGMSLAQPNYGKKLELIGATLKNIPGNIPSVGNQFSEQILNGFDRTFKSLIGGI